METIKTIPAAVLAVAILAFAGAALAHSYVQGDIRIGHIWARATPKGATTAAVYMPLMNVGTEPDALIGAESEVAEKIEIHKTVKTGEVYKMEMLDRLPLEPGKPVGLRPRGTHLMLFGLKKPLVQSKWFPLTLKFEKAGEARVKVAVEAIGAAGGDDH